MSNKVNYHSINKNTIKYHNELGDTDLPMLKEVCRKVLELNIALKEFSLKKAPNSTARNMCESSIANSKNGLKKIEEIENCETINDIIQRLGVKEWQLFCSILGVFSGTLNDDKFYEFDKEVSKWKTEQD